MPKARRPAIILGMDPTGLAVTRSLGRKGVEIIGVDSCPVAVGFTSRYCRRKVELNPRRDEEELLESLVRMGADYCQKPVVFASNDEALVFLARNSARLSTSVVFPRIDEDLLDQFLNKKRFSQLCERLNIPFPRTAHPENEKELSAAAAVAGFPCIIKPIYVHLWAKQYGLTKALVAKDAEELIKIYRGLDQATKRNVLIQEIIPGSDQDLYMFAGYFDRESQPRAIFTGRKLRQFPPGFGTATFAEPLWVPEVAEISERILKALDFNGLCDVELKKDRRDGSFKTIEINPRAGRYFSLVESSGVNVVYSAYLDLAGEKEKIKPPGNFKNVKWMVWSRDILAAPLYLRRKELRISDWIKSIIAPKNLATFSIDDPLPFLGYFLEVFYKLLSYFSRSKTSCEKRKK